MASLNWKAFQNAFEGDEFSNNTKMENLKMEKMFRKDYRVQIDTVPLPEKPEERINVMVRSITPVINQIISDAMNVAIGTWPTPEKSRPDHQA